MSIPTNATGAQTGTEPNKQPPVAAQTTGHLMMVRPAHFGSNPETAADNAFQASSEAGQATEIAAKARAEFDAFVVALQAVGVDVLVVEDTTEPIKNDAVFPNNWITTHEDGLLVTYPMYSPIRQRERRQDIIESLNERFGFTRFVDLSAWEKIPNKMLEGTGSMILDRVNRVAYACLSQRTTLESLEEWAQLMGYEAVAFDATDAQGKPIYHTNVMMAMGSKQAVICLEAIADPAERERVVSKITAAGRTIVPITLVQMQQFAGNMLEVKGAQAAYWVMSSAAYRALQPEQLEALQQPGWQILHSDLSTIETYGGGSARCMLAELFLPNV